MTAPEIKEVVLSTARLATRHGRDLGPFIIPDLGNIWDIQDGLDSAGIRLIPGDPDFRRVGRGVIAKIVPHKTLAGETFHESTSVILWPQERLWKRLWRVLKHRFRCFMP